MKIVQNISRPVMEERGSTLFEMMVALTLLVSVVLPASMFVGYIARDVSNELRIIALGEAQSALEEVLQSGQLTSLNEETYVGPENTLRLHRVVRVNDGWAYLNVTVYRRGRKLVALSTARLVREEASEKHH